MSALIHRNDMVKKYKNDELSLLQKWCLDNEDKEKSIRLTKIFLTLNGASGCNVKNIPPNLAGFFSYFVHVRIYNLLQIWRSRVQIYQRHLGQVQTNINKIRNDFNTLHNLWLRMVSNEEITINDNQGVITNATAVKRFKEMEIITRDSYSNYTGAAWLPYYSYVRNSFEALVNQCETKGDSYRQNWLQWFGSMFNPVSWFNYACHGLQSHSRVANQYDNFADISTTKSNILFNRIEDIRTANDAFNDLRQWIDQERIAIQNPSNITATQINMQGAQMFKAECDRLMSIIRDRVGTIGNSNPIEN